MLTRLCGLWLALVSGAALAQTSVSAGGSSATFGIGALTWTDGTDLSFEAKEYFDQHPLVLGGATTRPVLVDTHAEADWAIDGVVKGKAYVAHDGHQYWFVPMMVSAGLLGGGLIPLVLGAIGTFDDKKTANAFAGVGAAMVLGGLNLLTACLIWAAMDGARSNSYELEATSIVTVRHHGHKVGKVTVPKVESDERVSVGSPENELKSRQLAFTPVFEALGHAVEDASRSAR